MITFLFAIAAFLVGAFIGYLLITVFLVVVWFRMLNGRQVDHDTYDNLF